MEILRGNLTYENNELKKLKKEISENKFKARVEEVRKNIELKKSAVCTQEKERKRRFSEENLEKNKIIYEKGLEELDRLMQKKENILWQRELKEKSKLEEEKYIENEREHYLKMFHEIESMKRINEKEEKIKKLLEKKEHYQSLKSLKFQEIKKNKEKENQELKWKNMMEIINEYESIQKEKEKLFK